MGIDRVQHVPAVHLVDDDDGFRAGMMRIMRAAGLRAFAYGCAGEFLIAQPDEVSGCILLDIFMPGPSGMELLDALVARGSPPIILVTANNDVLTTVEAMKSGAFGYVVKPVGAECILPLVRRAMQMDAEQRVAGYELEELRRRVELLTHAERVIFWGIAHNKLNKQLASDLNACERTIKAQRARMMQKLQFTSLPELVKAAAMLEAGSRSQELTARRAAMHSERCVQNQSARSV